MCTTSLCNDAKIHLVLNPTRSLTKVGSLIMNLHWGTDEVWLLWSVKGHIRPMPIYFFPLPGVHTHTGKSYLMLYSTRTWHLQCYTMALSATSSDQVKWFDIPIDHPYYCPPYIHTINGSAILRQDVLATAVVIRFENHTVA